MKIPKEDIMKATIKGAIGAIPIAGSFLSEYLGLALDNVAEARRNEWMDLVNDKLETLERLGHTMEELSKSEYFYTSIQLATQGAMKAHQKEKREMFANAIYNGFLMTDTSDDKKLIFFSLLDKYTLTHMKFLHDYLNFTINRNQDLDSLKNYAMKYHSDLNNFVRQTMHSEGLLTDSSLPGGLSTYYLTKFGYEFLNFIKTPEEETK